MPLKKGEYMKMPFNPAVIVYAALILMALSAPAKAAATPCRACADVTPGSPQEVRIEYTDGTSRSACGLRCAGAMLAAYRVKNVKSIRVMEHGSGLAIDAKKAFWVNWRDDGPPGAFSMKEKAESFASAQGGKISDYRGVMTALFSGMYDAIRKSQPPAAGEMTGDDIAARPSCAYCGMDRKRYAHSRALLVYPDGSEAGLCSVHCAGIDMALHPEKGYPWMMVGTYDRRTLVDAERAVWVLGGSVQGIMSIRGKWAFESKKDAEAFTAGFGGAISDLRHVMIAAFEDMWEIIR